jgi:hypothetical protein
MHVPRDFFAPNQIALALKEFSFKECLEGFGLFDWISQFN